ncbi:putative quinol monooxygenase [Ekhidna sp.]|uniref:putative quinol monooxygenase n=1 Tax=Ekhidna sp. TaxID=2608089 RepID=UPI003B500F8A
MLIRIVRMDFEPEKVNDFLALFETVKENISTFPGCKHLELCKDANLDHVYYTFSKWESEGDLEKYRHSALFEDTWAKTKVLFGGKPLAYSLLPD